MKGRVMEGTDVSYDSIALEEWSRDMCMAEIERLEVEIPLLSEELKQQTAHPRETTLAQLDRLISEVSEDDSSETDPSLFDLQQELNLLHTVTGIELTDTTCSILGFGSDTIRRMFMLKGLCSTVPFQINFTVTERHMEGDRFEAVMTQLSSHVTGDMSPHLASVIKQHEVDRSSTNLIQTLSASARCHEQRRELYCHLVEKYDCVSLPEGKAGRLLKIEPQNSPEWTIFWSEVVTESCAVTPVIQLFVKASTAMLDVDDDRVCESAPRMFQRMLETLGHARAIEVLIQTVTSLSWRQALDEGLSCDEDPR